MERSKSYSGQTATFTATNSLAQEKIEVTKYGKDPLNSNASEYKVVGAKFDIKNSSGQIVESITTNSSGIATSKELPLGNYTVVETYVLDPLVINQTPIKANILYKDQTPIIIMIIASPLFNGCFAFVLHFSQKSSNILPIYTLL